jgi:hypothetical protein
MQLSQTDRASPGATYANDQVQHEDQEANDPQADDPKWSDF